MRLVYFAVCYGFWGYNLYTNKSYQLFPGEVFGFSPIVSYFLAISLGELL